MCHHQDAGSALLIKSDKFIFYKVGSHHVKRTRRLIAQQYGGFKQHDRRDGYPLIHTAAQLVGSAPEQTSRAVESHPCKCLLHLTSHIPSIMTCQHFPDLRFVLPDRIERSCRILRNITDCSSEQLTSFLKGEAGDFIFPYFYAPLPNLQVLPSCDRSYDGGLAAAALPHYA